MKLALLFLLLSTLALRATDLCQPFTLLHLSKVQLDEFDSTYEVTLTPEQKQLLQKRAGVAPTRLHIEYHCPDGGDAELGYNIALKVSKYDIKVLHYFLMSDRDAKKKHEDNVRLINAGGIGPSTKEYPAFRIDSEGKLWQFLFPGDLKKHVSRDPKNIGMLYFYVPSHDGLKNTTASEDTLRRLMNFAKAQGVPVYVISGH